MKNTLFTLFFAVFSCLLMSSELNAKIYKWTDKNGNTHFSDKPPKDKNIKVEEQDLSNINVIAKPASKPATQLTPAVCQRSVDNVKKAMPKFKEQAMKEQGVTELDPTTDAMLDEVIAQLTAELTVETCLESKGKDAESFLCMANKADVLACM